MELSVMISEILSSMGIPTHYEIIGVIARKEYDPSVRDDSIARTLARRTDLFQRVSPGAYIIRDEGRRLGNLSEG